MKKRIAVIGAGFSGISAASYLAKLGFEVDVYEKNSTYGGRARQYTTPEGFVFDMGPSWYWMPEVFEYYFQDFGKNRADLYHLDLLSPSFDIVFKEGNMKVPADYNDLRSLFESLEEGAANKLDNFMSEAQFKYEFGMNDMVQRPSLHFTEFVKWDVIVNAIKLNIFSSLSQHVKSYFRHPYLIALMEFPVLFLGAMPKDMPSLYSLMNYAGLKLGTWYPQGGFGRVIDSMVSVAEEQGVRFHRDSPVEKILYYNQSVTGVVINGKEIPCDALVASADYHHVETRLLDSKVANYSNSYWKRKTLAPSSLLFYLGVSKKIDKLEHHTLFFDESMDQHSIEIYKRPQWPSRPLFYVCTPSKTDPTVAPQGMENIFVLMPHAVDLMDSIEVREYYYEMLMDRLERYVGESIRKHVIYKNSYCIKEFVSDYNSMGGNAYGLANTLGQTAFLKPKMTNKHLRNMVYTGQLTVPGPGVPPSLISGKIAAKLIYKKLNGREAAL